MNTLSRRALLNGGLALGAVALAPRMAAAADAAAGESATAHSAAAIDPMSLVAPELRGPLQYFTAHFPEMKVDAAGLPAMRSMKWAGMPGPAATPAWERRLVPGSKGAPQVPVYVINAQPPGSGKPALLHIHGGGFVAGNAESNIPQLQAVARDHDCVVVSVEYRLAPETPFPGSLEDNYAALRWLHSNAGSLGADAARIAVMGESAGGGHAAMLAIAVRDRREFTLRGQILIYPMLDDRTASTRVVPAAIGQFIWKREANRFGWTSLLGVPAGSRRVPAGAVPARVADLAGLPPTFVGVGAIDLFVEEDIQYAQRLVAAGVPTELVVIPGAYHGFDIFVADSPQAKLFRSAWNEALARAFAA
ncbi:MAG: hypothetical protein RL684_1941 [Pseudomonadota bacterium]|jgi:acetyl esterase/lipase